MLGAGASAQPSFSQPHGLFDGGSLSVEITGKDAGAEIRYTTDGSEPTAISEVRTDDRTDDRYYNLNGQVVTHPTQGIYIRNGKKIIKR